MDEFKKEINGEITTNSASIDVMKGQVVEKAQDLSSKDKKKLFSSLGWNKESVRLYYGLFQAYVDGSDEAKEKLPNSSAMYQTITAFANSTEYREYSSEILGKTIPSKQNRAFHQYTSGAIDFILSQTDYDNLGSIKGEVLKEIAKDLKPTMHGLVKQSRETREQKAVPEQEDTDKEREEVFITLPTNVHNTSMYNGFPKYEWNAKHSEFTPMLSMIAFSSTSYDRNFFKYLEDNNIETKDRIIPKTKKDINESSKALSDAISNDLDSWAKLYKKMAKVFHSDAPSGSDSEMQMVNLIKDVVDSNEQYSKNKERRETIIDEEYDNYANSFDKEFFSLLTIATQLNSMSGMEVGSNSDEYNEYINLKISYEKALEDVGA